MKKQGASPHFEGEEAASHVAKVQATGIFTSSEIHGFEPPGHLMAACDAGRECAVFLLMVFIALQYASFQTISIFQILGTFLAGWVLWKGGRAAWLAWARLERMHRIVEQERWEITHHQDQEREELKELYRLKGLEGKLLEDVIDVFMADEDRLLQVMVEEELCLKINSQEHPLKQALGASLGVLSAGALSLSALFAFPPIGIWAGCFASITLCSAFSSYLQGNDLISATIWSLGIGAASIGTTYFLFQIIGA